MQPIISPNLPQKSVKAVLIDCKTNKKIIKLIEKQGIEAILVPQCSDLPFPVNSHPDMLCHHLGGKKIIVYKKITDIIGAKLENLSFEVIQSDYELKTEYSFDCAFNAARMAIK